MIHERFTSPRLGDLIEVSGGLTTGRPDDDDVVTNLRETRRLYERSRKLPPALVEELSRTSVLSEQAGGVRSGLRDVPAVDGQDRGPQAAGGRVRRVRLGNLYDALLDEYEPGETRAVRRVFDALRAAARRPDPPDRRVVARRALAEILRRFTPVRVAERPFSRGGGGDRL